MSRPRLALFIALAVLGACRPAQAADERGLARRVAAAKAGATIRLEPGDYGVVTLIGVRFARPVTLDASAARFTGIVLRDVHGLTLHGGTVIGPGGRSYGLWVDRSSQIRVEGMTLTGAHRGIVVNQSEDLAFVGNRFVKLISDGIDVALSRRVLIERNICRDFDYTRPVFTADGVRVKDGDHPDCIQAWSRPTAPPTSDIRVIGNDIDGDMQGIFFGNHQRNGVDDGGFDRITIMGNKVRVGSPHGITLTDARMSTVRDNSIATIPGARLPKPPFPPVRAALRVSGAGNVICGNVVEARTDSEAGCRN